MKLKQKWFKPVRFTDGSIVTEWNRAVYGGLLDDFEQFEVDRRASAVVITGRHRHTGALQKRRIPITYRTDDNYKRRLLAKFYKLDDWYKNLPHWRARTSMITLTSKQREFTYFEQYNFIQSCYRDWREIVRKEYPDLDFVLIGEPHKTGYLHYHILVFREFSEAEELFLKNAWLSTGAGNDSSFKISQSGKLRRARNYLMKYIKKGLLSDDDDDTLADSDLKRFDSVGDDRHFEIFNAVLWRLNKHDAQYKGVRVFQMSKSLSAVCKLEKFGNDIYIDWFMAEYISPSGDVFPVWQKELPDLTVHIPPPFSQGDVQLC